MCGMSLSVHSGIVCEYYLINVAQPLGDVLKRLSARDVVDEDDAHCTAVVRRCDGVKTLLPCRVPIIAPYSHNTSFTVSKQQQGLQSLTCRVPIIAPYSHNTAFTVSKQ